MGLALPGYALAFNVLLWIVRASLATPVAAVAGAAAAWTVTAAAPTALLGIAVRMRAARLETLLLVSAASLGLAGLLANL